MARISSKRKARPRVVKRPVKTKAKPVGKPRRESAVDRVIVAADAFRRGRPVLIRAARGAVLAYAVETLADATLKTLRKAPLQLLLTHARATTLKIRLYTPDVVVLAVERGMNADQLRAIADPTADLANPLKGPFNTLREALSPSYAAAVKLAKLAGLLPSAVVLRAKSAPSGTATLDASDIQSYDEEVVRTLKLVTRVRIPLEGAEKSELAAFRPEDGGPEHYAIIINAPPTDEPVLARLHSECFTGDFLGSLKCDCGTQLRGAIEAISKAGGGVLLYLAQEGRGIGLINKLRAYKLQNQGFDTVEANERLGFEPEERLYGIGARMLAMLGYRSVRLMTNNPDKVAALAQSGVNVVERVAHAFPDNEHNRAYLRTKAEKAGHFL